MARAEWKPRTARCGRCRKRQRCVFHHVVYRQHIEKLGGDVWDFRNAMPVGTLCQCHANHHAASRRFLVSILPLSAIDFAVDLLGQGGAVAYFDRYYDVDVNPVSRRRPNAA